MQPIHQGGNQRTVTRKSTSYQPQPMNRDSNSCDASVAPVAPSAKLLTLLPVMLVVYIYLIVKLATKVRGFSRAVA